MAKVTAATWEFWLKADNGGLPTSVERGALYGEFPAGTLNRTRHYLRLEGIGTGTRSALYDEYKDTGGTEMGPSDGPLFETSTFTQIVVTKDGDTMTFYKDGVQVGATKTSTESFHPTDNPAAPTLTYFGMREASNGNNESFDGQFNIIRVYDTALTPAEIEGNFDSETIGGGGDAIPEPATMCALGMAVAGLGGYVRRRRMA